MDDRFNGFVNVEPKFLKSSFLLREKMFSINGTEIADL